MSYKIEITHKQDASNPELPSTFFGGCGSDRGEFLVTGNPMPTEAEVDAYLSEEIVDFCMQSYDPATGIGKFVVVDGWAPDVGTLYYYDDI